MASDVRPLVVGIPNHWGTVIPPLQHSVTGAAVLDNQFEPLVRQGKNGLIEPFAASSWEVSPDHRVVRFKIDTTRRFSDGSHLRAADFKRSWEDGLRMAAKSDNSSVADALDHLKGFAGFSAKGTIEGIRVLGDDSLELEFDRPQRLSIEHLAGMRYAAYKMANGGPIGTGPYVMAEKGQELILTPNPFYAGNDARPVQAKIVVITPDTARAKLQSGEIDAALFAEKLDLPECINGTTGKIRCVFGQEEDHLIVDVNGLSGSIFHKRENRLALQTLINLKLDELGLPGSLGTKYFVRDAQSFLSFQAGRLPEAEAIKLIHQGRKFIPGLRAASKKRPIYLVSNRDCQWLISLLRDEGIAIAGKSGRTEFSRILEMIYKTHEADLVLSTFSIYNGDPDGLYHVLGKNGAIHSPMEDRDGVQDLMEAGREILDQAKLSPHYQKTARAILNQVPYVHLGYNSGGVAYNTDRIKIDESLVNRHTYRVTIFEQK